MSPPTPPGLVGAAVLFWGWQTGLWPLALPMAAALEAARWVDWRWDLSRADVHRVSDLCRLLLLAVGSYLFATRPAARAVWGVAQWYPVVLLPLAVCQTYGSGPRIDLWSFLLVVRRRPGDDPDDPSRRPIDVTYPYVAVCVLAASAANARSSAFYLGLCGLAVWALAWVRPRHVALWRWGAVVLLVAALGYGGHQAMNGVQRILMGTIFQWYLAEMLEADPYRATTAIGHLGELKASERIVLRVDPGPGIAVPILLRQASYSVYRGSSWFAFDAPFASVRPEEDATTWTLHPDVAPQRHLGVSTYLRRGRAVLPLPLGAARLEGLEVVRVEQNGLGAVKVDEGLGLVSYRVGFDPAAPQDVLPAPADARLPVAEAAVVARIADDLGLAALPPGERVARIQSFFREHFRYSLYPGQRGFGISALEEFLLHGRAGHCEYFATATVLLLRAAGVPARYAVGYSVQEWSGLEQRLVARARHAHAWALAYVDGTWQDVDTTPPAWFPAEAAQASTWEPVYDLLAYGFYLFSEWRWSEESGVGRYLAWLLLPLIAFLAWRLRFARRREERRVAPRPAMATGPRAGLDSEFFEVERRLRDLGFARTPGELSTRWLARLAATPRAAAAEPLAGLLALHYRYRFDPRGLAPAEREALRAGARAWLARHGTASSPRVTASRGNRVTASGER